MTTFSNKFAQDIYLQKYSLNGQEQWPDTCKRVVDNICAQLLDNKSKEKILKFMIERKFIPGGRYLYSAGRSFHQVNNCFDGDTRFLTKQGVASLRDKVGQQVEVKNWKGEWELAEVKAFGIQSLYRMILSNGDEFLTTENHLWIQPDGSRLTTKNVKRVMLTQGDTSLTLDPEGIRHGIIFGDGYKHPNTGYTEIIIVNPKKDEALVSYFEDKEVEITVGFGVKRKYQTIRKVKAGTKIALQPKHYKDLPISYTPEYARGFIAGLIATDGHASLGGSVLITCEGMERAKKLREIAIAGGCVASSIRINSKISPYDGSPREMCFIYLKPFSAPIILPYHQENMKNRKFYKREMYLDVLDVQPAHQAEVFCVVAPKTNTFTLGNGVLTSNCFLFRAEDTREGWAETMQKATAALMTGGGIGFDYSALREEGAIIKRTGGTSTGPLAHMAMVNEAGRYIMQGGQRRSAIWAGLNWSHPDAKKFIHVKDYSQAIKDAKEKDFNFPAPMELTNISVIYDTEFFIAIEDEQHVKHQLAKQIWADNCLQAFSTAEPGMSFNFRKDNESLRNAPVTAKTRVLTINGYAKVGDIVNQKVRVWTGKQWADTTFKRTKENANLVEVKLSNGRSITCDPEHPFIVKEFIGAGKNKKVIENRIAAKDLNEDQKIVSDLPSDTSFENRFIHNLNEYGKGFVFGDGTIKNGRGEISYHADDKKESFNAALDGLNAHIVDIPNRAYFKCDIDSKEELLNKKILSLDFISGWFDANGCYTRNLLRMSSANQNHLFKLQESLDFYGIKSVVREDGNSSYKPENKMFTLGVLSDSLVQFKNKIPTIRLNVDVENDYVPYRSSEIRVVSVQELEHTEDVYCCDVGVDEHSFMAEGVIISNCTEVVSEDDSDKCNLGTVWINRIKDKKELAEVVKYSTLFLLCGGIYSDVPTDKIRLVGNKNNRIGLGLGGIHEWLMQRGEGYNVTPELHKWLSIYEQESDAAAFVGAKQLGVAVPKGIRAIAPTGTIGIIAETTTGIEPLFCKAYKRRYFKEGKWLSQYVVDGSVKRLLDQGVKLEDIKDSYDLSFKQRVKFQADVQNYVDMAISSTCNLPMWGSEQNNIANIERNADVLLKYAKRLRGFTVYPDGCRGGQPLTRVDLQEAMTNEGMVFEEQEIECVGGVCGI